MGTFADSLATIEAVDLSTCSGEELRELGALSRGIRSYLEGFDVRLTKAAAASPETTSQDVFGGRGGRETDRQRERAETTDRLPELGEALDAGTISGEHVDAVSRASKHTNARTRAALAAKAAELAAKAREQTPEQFDRTVKDEIRRLSDDDGVGRNEQLRRSREIRRWTDHDTGARKTLFVLDPENDARLWSTIDAVTAMARQTSQDDTVTFKQLQVDAVLSHVCDRTTTATDPARPPMTRGGRPADEYLRRVPQVSVLIDLDTLRSGLHDRSVCEYVDGTPLPVDSVRRLCCSADILPVVLDGSGAVLDLGRSKRIASSEQRNALAAMYATCSHPDCHVPFDRCEVHHATPWQHGGRTDVGDLTPLCDQHHHDLHEGRWRLELGAGRRSIWYRPDGTVYFDGVTVDRRRTTSSRAA